MSASSLAFWGFSFLALVGGCVVAFSSNILRSGLSLLMSFFGIAGLYVLLGADFLAGTQVLLYVGGIVVLILFAVFVTSRIKDIEISNESRNVGGGGFFATLLFMLLAAAAVTAFKVTPAGAPPAPSTLPIGRLLLTTYALPFEVVSLLLLVALMGAAIIVRKETRPDPSETDAVLDASQAPPAPEKGQSREAAHV